MRYASLLNVHVGKETSNIPTRICLCAASAPPIGVFMYTSTITLALLAPRGVYTSAYGSTAPK